MGSTRQWTVALSTEAEYIAASQTMKKIMDEKYDQWSSYVQEPYESLFEFECNKDY